MACHRWIGKYLARKRLLLLNNISEGFVILPDTTADTIHPNAAEILVQYYTMQSSPKSRPARCKLHDTIVRHVHIVLAMFPD